jgi:hypothetical protein
MSEELNCPGNNLDSCAGCSYWRLGNPRNKCTWDGHPDNKVQKVNRSGFEPINVDILMELENAARDY